MLVLSRRSGERIIIADLIELTVMEVRGERVKLGFKAPPQISIQRAEIVRSSEQEPASQPASDVDLPPPVIGGV